ncbi:MAG: TonB-dependent receptor plug domain-containing protein [Crocinitomicaceae bacterium]|jgi:hypothetical protein|nr:TonB-dependent receptor plug domain-containing protein [Crocinitomicaceae bacterium]MBT5403339.1 TonB-dependent receptor plug domain-containing protein [Crocinitomicaceae bacterium]MBT6030680.1 TonB-dependent receptor plug domain-containing protein [Crocinitomicaceae bacterium]
MMKATIQLILSLLILFSNSVISQTGPGEIKGKVFNDLVEPEPYIEVWVDITGTKKLTTTTDDKGNFTLKPLDPGTYVVYATGFGYDTTIIKKVKVTPDHITYLNDIDISAAVVAERKTPIIIKDDPTLIRMDSDQIKVIPVRYDPVAMIESMSPEIKKGADGELYFRGSRNGAAIYYVDGVKLRSTLANLPARSYGSIQVYTGGIPAKYGDTTGGVVAIETQGYFSLWRQEKNRRDIARKKASRN